MVTELVIPESITSIGKYKFWGLSGVKSLIIGKGVTKIGAHAFSHCPDLETIEIGENVATLESMVNTRSTNLTNELNFNRCGRNLEVSPVLF